MWFSRHIFFSFSFFYFHRLICCRCRRNERQKKTSSARLFHFSINFYCIWLVFVHCFSFLIILLLLNFFSFLVLVLSVCSTVVFIFGRMEKKNSVNVYIMKYLIVECVMLMEFLYLVIIIETVILANFFSVFCDSIPSHLFAKSNNKHFQNDDRLIYLRHIVVGEFRKKKTNDWRNIPKFQNKIKMNRQKKKHKIIIIK